MAKCYIVFHYNQFSLIINYVIISLYLIFASYIYAKHARAFLNQRLSIVPEKNWKRSQTINLSKDWEVSIIQEL